MYGSTAYRSSCNNRKLHEEYGLLGCNTMQLRDSPTSQRNVSPPSSESKSIPYNKPAEADSKQGLLGLLFNPDDGSNTLLRNIRLSPNYT